MTIDIKDYEGKTQKLSNEVYELTSDSGDPGYPQGMLVRKITSHSSKIPGYHFDPKYSTVCSIFAKQAEFLGVKTSTLKRCERFDFVEQGYEPNGTH